MTKLTASLIWIGNFRRELKWPNEQQLKYKTWSNFQNNKRQWLIGHHGSKTPSFLKGEDLEQLHTAELSAKVAQRTLVQSSFVKNNFWAHASYFISHMKLFLRNLFLYWESFPLFCLLTTNIFVLIFLSCSVWCSQDTVYLNLHKIPLLY